MNYMPLLRFKKSKQQKHILLFCVLLKCTGEELGNMGLNLALLSVICILLGC